ncbi:MAG: 4-diphosphocytidyl-2C-methyl-D-erythritol kinase [Bacteroidetes bacterium]|nr:4-diphosphocytidyl-2C-methyl-D-erythritol kinase [Bacteroidota bacterium]
MRDILSGRSHAKINLGLRIIRKRPDGFHDIETVFHRVGLHDVIEIREADDISVVCTDPAAPSDETNLAYRAAALLRAAAGTRGGASISITKRIPVGAGLGGGSSNAASVLTMLREFWNARVPDGRLQEIALQLGSDVPYFLGSGSAAAYGRGERLAYFDLEIPFAILVCTPGLHVSTAWAYRSVTPRGGDPGRPLKEELTEALRHPELLPAALVNDFEPSVFAAFPTIAEARQRLLETGAVCASMSGSGSSVFGFYRTTEEAGDAVLQFRAPGTTTHVTPPLFQP